MKGWRTVAFNLVMGVVSIFGITAVDAETVNTAIAGAAAIWTVGNIVLRAVTNTPIFKKWTD